MEKLNISPQKNYSLEDYNNLSQDDKDVIEKKVGNPHFDVDKIYHNNVIRLARLTGASETPAELSEVEKAKILLGSVDLISDELIDWGYVKGLGSSNPTVMKMYKLGDKDMLANRAVEKKNESIEMFSKAGSLGHVTLERIVSDEKYLSEAKPEELPRIFHDELAGEDGAKKRAKLRALLRRMIEKQKQ